MELALGGKQNDCRITLYNMLSIVYDNSIVTFVMSTNESNLSDAALIKKYPDAKELYKLLGTSPYSYIKKKKIK